MPIQVTCPSCLSRFSVSDKFAGKKGPCPKCKKQISVPLKTDEVVIHAARDDAPKDSKGQSVLKPIKRTETRVTRRGVILTTVTIVGMLAAAAVLRSIGPVPWWAVVIGALVVAPPAIWAAYAFSRDAELAPYVGAELRNRLLILTAIFASLWLIYAYVPVYILDLNETSEMPLFMAGVMLVAIVVIGAFAAANVLELEFSGGLVVSGLYIVAALVLALIAGVQLASMDGKRKSPERELMLDPQPTAMRMPAESLPMESLPTVIGSVR